jgi:PAS domain S-box-containing protein
MNVLLAEDDTGFARILRRTLEKAGHAVTVAADGAEAWGILQQETFPLVISDWMMPVMDGPALCRRIRAQEGVPYTYVILLTSRGEREDRIEGLSSGADDFLAKHLGHGDLFARLTIAQRILNMQENLQRREEETARLNDRLRRQNEEMAMTNLSLERAYERFSELFEGLPVACYAYDAAGCVHDWNRAARDLFGYAADEAYGLTIPALVPEAGTSRPWQERIAQILSGAAHAGMEIRTRTRAGVPLRLLSHAIPVRGPAGQITGIISADIDITTRRALEDQVVDQLRQVTALNTELEQFATIACHDLKEPLRKIQVFNGRLNDLCGDRVGPQGKEYLGQIAGAAGRMQALIRDLFALTQVDRLEMPLAAVDMGQVVRNVVTDLTARLEETGGTVDIGDLPSVTGDSSQMHQLMQNLIMNSLKYHRPDFPPRVTVRAMGAARLEVADNGIGFDEQYLTRIFAPFQRLHGRGEYEGTGIGLALCKKIVERHSGTITARSRPGHGATFVIDFPPRAADGHSARPGSQGEEDGQ